MTYLLDTNICSAHMRRPGGLAHRFLQHSGRLAIPTVVLAELYAGAYMHPHPAWLLSLIHDLAQGLAVIDFDPACAHQFGLLRGTLTAGGIAVSSTDLMIASVALTHGLILVTRNIRDFQGIPGLTIENWLDP